MSGLQIEGAAASAAALSPARPLEARVHPTFDFSASRALDFDARAGAAGEAAALSPARPLQARVHPTFDFNASRSLKFGAKRPRTAPVQGTSQRSHIALSLLQEGWDW